MHIAVPLVLSAGSLSLMNVVDRVLLAWYSKDALAASMPGAMMHWSVLSVAIGIAAYSNTFVAQYDGAQRPDRVAATVWQATYLSIAAGLCLLLVLPFAVPIFRMIGHEASVQTLEVQYFQILSAGSTFFLLSTVYSSFFSGRGSSRVVLIVNVASVLANAGLDYLLIFGAGPIPEMGIRGAAIATVIAKFLSVVWFVLIMRTESRVFHFRRHSGLDLALLWRMTVHGLPNGLLYLADIAGFTCFLFMLGNLGTDELAATNIAFTINSMAYIPMMGVGTAVMTIVGQRIGEGRPLLAVQTTWRAFQVSSVYMMAFAAFCVIRPDLVTEIFASGQEGIDYSSIRATVVILLRFVVVYTFFDAMAMVFSAAIRGAGDSRFCVIFTFLSCWLLMVVPTYIAIFHLGYGLYAGWIAVTVYIVFVGIGYLARFLGGQWKEMKVIEESFVGGGSQSPPMEATTAPAASDDSDEEAEHVELGISVEG